MNGQHSKGSSSASRLPAFLVGLLLGGLAGAVTMLLLAPRAGKKTRSQIQKQGAKLRDEAVESMEDVATEAGDKAHQFTDSVQTGVGERLPMNRDVFEGKWKEMKGQVREWWGKITDDELEQTGGKVDQLVGLLQQKYGYSREAAEEEFDRRLMEVKEAVKQA